MHLLIDAFKCHCRACLAISIIKIECVVEMETEIPCIFFCVFIITFPSVKRLEKMNDKRDDLKDAFIVY